MYIYSAESVEIENKNGIGWDTRLKSDFIASVARKIAKST